MKKTTLFFSLLFLAFAISITGCKKDEEAEAPQNGTATITGVVRADTDVRPQSLATVETAPAGVLILAKINTADLVVNPNGSTYADKIYSTTVGANGTYSFTVDANSKPVTVTIMPQDFTFDRLRRNSADTADSTDQRVVYSRGSLATFTVVNGTTKIQDFQY